MLVVVSSATIMVVVQSTKASKWCVQMGGGGGRRKEKYMHACVYMFLKEGACTCMCTYMWSLENNLRCHLQESHLPLLDRVFLGQKLVS